MDENFERGHPCYYKLAVWTEVETVEEEEELTWRGGALKHKGNVSLCGVKLVPNVVIKPREL